MKHLPLVVATAALLGTTPLVAQARGSAEQLSNDVAEMCARTKCQINVHVVMRDKNGAVFDRTYAAFPPVVQPIGITVVAGQTVYIEADVVDGKLANLVAVDKVSNPGKTITATLEQIDGKGMILTTSNPFQQSLKWDMAVMPLDRENVFKTSSCPIWPGTKTLESWPSPIFLILLTRGRLLEKSDSLICSK